MYLQAAERLLAGGLPYRDTLDLNPPQVIYLSLAPTALAQLLDLHPIPTFLIFAWLLTVLSTLATRHLLRGIVLRREALIVDAVALGLAVASLVILINNDYGQREHLFALALLPYMAVRFRRWEGAPVPTAISIVVGVFMGLTIVMKPHFVAIVLSAELYWLLAHRKLQLLLGPETIAGAAMALLYALHFLIDPIGSEFFGRWVPLLSRGFSAYDSPMPWILYGQRWHWLPAFIAPLVLAVTPQPSGMAWKLSRPIAIAALTAGVGYFIQHKGWSYHAIPILVLASVQSSLVLGYLMAPTGTEEPAATWRTWLDVTQGAGAVRVAIMIGIVGVGTELVAQTNDILYTEPVNSVLAREIVKRTEKGDPVLVLSTDVTHVYPMLTQIQRPQASKFLYAFPLPLLYHDVRAAEGQPFPYRGTAGTPRLDEEDRFVAELRTDVETKQPKLIIVDLSVPCDGCPDGFELYDYLERTSFLSTALASYQRSPDIGRYALFHRR